MAKHVLMLLGGILLIWNAVTFAVTAHDKWAAKRDKRRTPEKHFRLFALFCGGAGVLAAFYIFRHKTKHYGLLFQVWALTVLSYAAAGFGIWKLWTMV